MMLGFTGPVGGMTPAQKETVLRLFQELPLTMLHHGMCVGADAEAHYLARAVGANITGHPPRNPKLYQLSLACEHLRPAYDYLTRDKHIVAEGINGLIATPETYVEPSSTRGDGTWTTINYARRAGRPIWFVWRDGTVTRENETATTLAL